MPQSHASAADPGLRGAKQCLAWHKLSQDDSSSARPAAAPTAVMKACLTPAFSSSYTPAMVVPAGEVTMSCVPGGPSGIVAHPSTTDAAIAGRALCTPGSQR